ncbi:unnamed protein product [Oikopleura dioica]|uniref:Uncharacterized protein n=1 Tax=Oikopleura dioica TaxID=34765 RepID=E4YA88_OIKDI|nr:unnamed protein product [Oikopleura dioica]
MSTSSDEVAILVCHIRDLQSKIEKDQKELNQLKEKVTSGEKEKIHYKEQVAELERILLLENEAHEATKKENTELRGKLDALKQDSVEKENNKDEEEDSSKDLTVENPKQTTFQSPEIDLDEILKMIKESEKRIAEAKAVDLLRLEEKIKQLKSSLPQ